MKPQTVGIVTAGEMGSGVGAFLPEHGVRVLPWLEGRSAQTHQRAQQAGMLEVPDLATLMRECEMVLSIVPPAAAPDIAAQLATAVRATNADVLIADCNAIAPGTVRGIAHVVTSAGARFAEALRGEQQRDMGNILAYLDRATPTMIPKAYRWVGEMEEIARCFDEVGLPGATFQGIAEVYRRVTECDDVPVDEVLDRVAENCARYREVSSIA